MISTLFPAMRDHHNRQRIKLSKQDWNCRSLSKYLNTPLPSCDQVLEDIGFISLDFETTGLDPIEDKVLSFGLVEMTIQQIDCSTLHETYVRNEQFVRPETAVVNEILPSHIIDNGVTENVAFEQLLDKIAGKVIIAHNAKLEASFLRAHMHAQYQLNSLPCLFVDTLSIEKNHSYHGKCKLHSSYQLNDLRAHYQLPDYHAHSAASDALACAELFLAQTNKLGLKPRKLRQLLV